MIQPPPATQYNMSSTPTSSSSSTYHHSPTSHPPSISPKDDADKFATLFSPPTPRASPVIPTLQLKSDTGSDPSSSAQPQSRPTHSHKRTDSDFGAFVSVPPTEDPLGLGMDELDSRKIPQPLLVPVPAQGKSKSRELDLLFSDDPQPFFDPHPPGELTLGSDLLSGAEPLAVDATAVQRPQLDERNMSLLTGIPPTEGDALPQPMKATIAPLPAASPIPPPSAPHIVKVYSVASDGTKTELQGVPLDKAGRHSHPHRPSTSSSSFPADASGTFTPSTTSNPSSPLPLPISPPAKRKFTTGPIHPHPSRLFFDRFAREAEERRQRGKGLVDELMRYEDEPMYWVREGARGAGGETSGSGTGSKKEGGVGKEEGSDGNEEGREMGAWVGKGQEDDDGELFGEFESASESSPTPTTSYHTSSSRQPSTTPLITPEPHVQQNLLDLDLDTDYFTPPPPPPPPHEPTRQRSQSPVRHFSPLRRRESTISPGSPRPVILAPPIVASYTASPPSQEHDSELNSDYDASGRPSPPNRSTSYQALSSLTSRFSSLLTGSHTAPSASKDTRPSAESIFRTPSDSGSGSSTTNTHPHPSSSPSHPRHPRHGATMPTTAGEISHTFPSYNSSSGPAPLQSPSTSAYTTLSSSYIPESSAITHSLSPFAPTVSHTTSPFATHVFVPPSGAPGFKGEEYDWDKGFSGELEMERDRVEEMVRERERELGEERVIDLGSTGNRERSRGRGGASLKKVDRKGLGGDAAGENRLLATANQPRPPIQVSVNPTMGMSELIEKKSGGIELKARNPGTAPVISGELADMIRTHFPALARLPRSWSLLYSIDQHGISLNTLYSRCEAALQPKKPGMMMKGSLLAIKDAGDAIFGAWIGEGIKPSKGKGYYGGGESFLWKFVGGKLQVYKWTGRNDYVALCEPEYLSFGGGDGHYGLYLDETLYDGSTAPCPTFQNDTLCSPGPVKAGGAIEFECVGLEVWGIGP